VKRKKIKEWALSKTMDHCVDHSHDLRWWWLCVPVPALSSSFPPEFCWVFSHAILRDWIFKDKIVDPPVLLLLLSPFEWLLLSRDNWLTPLEWRSGISWWHRRDPFSVAAGPKEEIFVSFLQEGNETSKQGSSCRSISQVFFFFSPTVCFFYGRTFCLASLWRSCFSMRQWLGNRGMLMTAHAIAWLIELKSVVVSRHKPNDSPLVCCGLFWNSFGETGCGSFCSDVLYVWHVALSLTTESSGEVWIGSQYTLIYFYVFNMYFVCPVLLLHRGW